MNITIYRDVQAGVADMALGLNKNIIYMPYVKVRRCYGFAKEPYKSVST
ncbi:MAG: hypothetical protein IJV15_11910 [Lachnospiraceae bacterium]|nr:hypothetical protein [Lachnospiraceae bacterium]